MEINYKIDTLDGVDDSIKQLYKETDSGYQLNVSGLPKQEDVGALKRAHERSKAAVLEYKEKLSGLEKFSKLQSVEGFDPDNIEELMAKANAAGDPDAIARLEAKHKVVLEKAGGQYGELEQKYNALKRDVKNNGIVEGMRKAAIDAGVLPHKVDDLIMLTRANFDSDEKEVFVRDADGHPTGITPKDWFGSVQLEARPDFFKSSGATGSGARNASGTPLTMENARTPEQIRQYLSRQNFAKKSSYKK